MIAIAIAEFIDNIANINIEPITPIYESFIASVMLTFTRFIMHQPPGAVVADFSDTQFVWLV